MKRIIFAGVLIIMLLSGIKLDAAVSSIANGSFEADKWITNIRLKDPNSWDVNMADNFSGYVDNYWSTDGNFSLTFLSSWFVAFDVNDMAAVSQMVSFRNVKKIIFDLRLYTYPETNIWDMGKRKVAVLLDETIIWSSSPDSLDIEGPDATGVYYNREVAVNITDSNLHQLSLALISKVEEDIPDTFYYVDWDNVALDCRGLGVFEGDINRDCVVDFNDYKLIANYWLAEVEPESKYNLSQVGDVNGFGVINFLDHAVLANIWTGIEMEQLDSLRSVWLQQVQPDDPNNLFQGDDVTTHGVIDWPDLDVFVQDWLKASYD